MVPYTSLEWCPPGSPQTQTLRAERDFCPTLFSSACLGKLRPWEEYSLISSRTQSFCNPVHFILVQALCGLHSRLSPWGERQSLSRSPRPESNLSIQGDCFLQTVSFPPCFPLSLQGHEPTSPRPQKRNSLLQHVPLGGVGPNDSTLWRMSSMLVF